MSNTARDRFEIQLKEVMNFVESIGQGEEDSIVRKATTIVGKKYIKLLVNKMLYCFIDKETGDIYKASSWNKPAKGARANIFQRENWGVRLKEYGPLHLR